MNNKNWITLLLLAILIAGIGCLVMMPALADEHEHEHRWKGYFEREDRYGIGFMESADEGNETAGQIAAWLLLVANLPVAFSILIKGANRFLPLGDELKKLLSNFARQQKKALMWLHYHLNMAILGIVMWHWVSSRCKSSALPELGLVVMIALIVSGVITKFNLSPPAFRKSLYRIHTQPVIFVSLFLVLTLGHLIVD